MRLSLAGRGLTSIVCFAPAFSGYPGKNRFAGVGRYRRKHYTVTIWRPAVNSSAINLIPGAIGLGIGQRSAASVQERHQRGECSRIPLSGSSCCLRLSFRAKSCLQTILVRVNPPVRSSYAQQQLVRVIQTDV